MMGATGAAVASVFTSCKKNGGPNNRVRVAVIGLHGRGEDHLNGLLEVGGVEIAALADCDTKQFEPRLKLVAGKGQKTVPVTHQDFRKVLEDKAIDAITLATPNHWHALMTVLACQAGKDVYVEKPLSHNFTEGKRLVEAAAKYKRMVQHGTQERSNKLRALEAAHARAGTYGKLQVAKGYCCKPRWSIGVEPEKKPFKTMDWNLWLGPAAERPYHKNLHPYNWHWFWDFGNGDMGNQGIHQMDLCRWALGEEPVLPKAVWSLGGRFGYKDQGETPNMLLTVLEFGGVQIVFETRGLVGSKQEHAEVFKDWPENTDVEFFTEQGKISRGRFTPNGGGSGSSLPSMDLPMLHGSNHMENWLDAVRSRDGKSLHASAETGHYSAALVHLGNISYRLGAEAEFDKKAEAFGDGSGAGRVAVESFEMIKSNTKAVGVDLRATKYLLGRRLEFDGKTEKFAGAPEADALLGGKYRAPFVVPDVV